MKTRTFLIPTLLAAGMLPQPANAHPAPIGLAGDQDGYDVTAALALFRGQGELILAQHRSHRSHSSHSSHRSSAGGGGTYRAPVYRPAPVYTPPRVTIPRTTPAPRATSPSTRPGYLRSQPDGFTSMVQRVQRGLIAFGYDVGDVDGVVGPQTRTALERFQRDFSLPVTGTITPAVLNALGIASTGNP